MPTCGWVGVSMSLVSGAPKALILGLLKTFFFFNPTGASFKV